MNKRLIIILLIVIVILGGGGALWYYKTHPNTDPTVPIITYRDPKLSQEEIKPFLDRIDLAKKELAELANNTPKENKYQLLLKIGAEYYPIGELEKARDYDKQATDLIPTDAAAWYSLASVEIHMQDYTAARTHIDKALSIEPANPEYWRTKLDLSRDIFHYSTDQMKDLYKQALDGTHEHVDIVAYYAKFLDSSGDLAGAVAQWKKAIEKNPDGKASYEKEIKNIQAKVQ